MFQDQQRNSLYHLNMTLWGMCLKCTKRNSCTKTFFHVLKRFIYFNLHFLSITITLTHGRQLFSYKVIYILFLLSLLHLAVTFTFGR